MKQHLSREQADELIQLLKVRFEKNMERHPGLVWENVQVRLEKHPEKLWSLGEMECTGGEPDVIGLDEITGSFIFYDCASESPKGRRSFCYDHEALESRKEHKPGNSAINCAHEMGVEILSETEYRNLQKLGKFDTKTSSWIQTPPEVRKLGGALFCDWRYAQVFTYHNGAESYYAARGFRTSLKI